MSSGYKYISKTLANNFFNFHAENTGFLTVINHQLKILHIHVTKSLRPNLLIFFFIFSTFQVFAENFFSVIAPLFHFNFIPYGVDFLYQRFYSLYILFIFRIAEKKNLQ